MRRLTSILLVTTLLLGIVPFLSSYSQPNACINLNNNGIKTPELIAQFETWLNEPDGLNARFLDRTESSFERGQRLFYDLVLNNNQICLSDLTQEMIDSISKVIRSYDNAVDHNYLVNGLTVSRSQINLGFKSVRNPILLANPSIFAEAIQFSRPIADDYFAGFGNSWLFSISPCAVGPSGSFCWEQIDETVRSDSDFILTPGNPNNINASFLLSSLIDPMTDTDHFLNYTYGKSSAGGIQIDFEFTLTQGENGTQITSILHIDSGASWIQNNYILTTSEASSITDYTDLHTTIHANSVGGGAGRGEQHSWQQFVTPTPFNIQTALPIATISQMLFQVHGGTSGGLHHFVLQEIFQEHNSFSNWIEVFRDEDIIRFRLCALPTPVSRNATNHILRFTALSRGTGVVERLSIHILNSTQDIIQEFPETDISRNEFETHSFTLTQANADAIDNYSLIFIELHATNLGVNDDESIFITQAQLDIPETDLTLVCIPEEAEGIIALGLAPIGPQIMLAFILVGLLALGQSNPWFVLGGWISMAMAFGMSLTGQIYIGLGSSDNLLTFSQAFPEDFSIWIFRFFIMMQFVYPIRIFALVYERLITIISSLRTRLG